MGGSAQGGPNLAEQSAGGGRRADLAMQRENGRNDRPRSGGIEEVKGGGGMQERREEE